MKKNVFKLYGFTLIELLVVLSIISVLFGLGYANYRKYQQKQAVMGVIRQIDGDIKLAQEYAFSGSKPSGYTCTVLNGYKFEVYADNAYKVSAACVPDGDREKKNVTIPAGIKLSPVGGSSIVLFKTLAQGTNLNSDVKITATLGSTTTKASITISKTGETTSQFE